MLSLLFISGNCLPLNATCTPGNRIYDCTMSLYCDNNGFCQSCKDSSDCDSGYTCHFSDKDDINVCSYLPLIHKWKWRLIIGMIVLFLAGIFVSGVGIGGGGLFVPIMMLISDYPADYSISSSNPIIFGGSIAVCLFNFRKKHPEYDRPLINYNIAAIIEPISWLGTIIGVIINGVIPDWLLYLIQFILLGYTAFVTFKKGYKEWKKKKVEQIKAIEMENIENPLNSNNDNDNHKVIDSFSKSDQNNSDLSKISNSGFKEKEFNDNFNENFNDNSNENQSSKSESNDNLQNDNESNENLSLGEVDAFETQLTQEENISSQKAYSPWVLIILVIIWVVFVIIPFIR